MNLYLKTAKCTIIICCLFLLQTAVFAQSNIRITIKKTEITLQNALIEVEKQSKLSVAYNQSQLSNKRQLSLDIVNQPLESALKTILKGTGFSYKLTDKYIMIVPEKKETNSQTAKVVKGKIVDENGEPLIGVNVAIDGTTTGTITDFDGNFSMSAFANSTLKVSYIGYATQLIAIANKDFYSITMRPDNEVLDEVVVTALGIKRETKSLTYNVQEMKAADLTTVKDASFMNSLAGKIAGVTINQSASGIGGSTRVVMRGLKSITNDNNALYVIDGIPMASMRSNQDKSFYENADGGDSDGISSINPDDIESMSVLTGAAAAALYGSSGANGVVLITTKKGEEGKLRVSYSNDTQFMTPFVMPEFQNTYGSAEGEFSSWGAAKATSWEPKDFFQTGFTETNSLALSAGNNRNQTYFSAASTNARGIIPNNTYNRYNFTLRNTTELIEDKLTLDMSASYIITNDNNMMSQGQYHNPLVPLYLFPRGDDMNKYKVYERYNSEKYYDVQYWPYGNQGMAMQNPYWIVNRENMGNHKSRYMFSANLNYKVLDWLNIVGRMRVDNSFDTYERKISASSDQLFASEYGNYLNMKTSYKNTYGDIMAQINKRWKKWNITANVGGSFNHMIQELTGYEGHLSSVPNLFTFGNIIQSSSNTKATQNGYIDDNQAVFATFQLGYNSMAYLDITGRNDWYSSLANTKSEKTGFFYPSIGLSAVVSEIFDLSKARISFLKMRVSYSEVGNPPMRHITMPTYSIEGGKVSTSARLLNPDLKPERTKSFEVGMNMRMFGNLLNFDLTYYNSNTFNQFFNYTMPPSSGYSYYTLNGGKVNNWGIEARLGINADLGPVKWNSNLTFTMNRNTVDYLLPDGATNPLTGEPIYITEIEPFNPQGSYKMIVKEGGTLGDIYVTGLKTDHKGNIKVNATTGAIEADPNTWMKAGSTAPRFNWGWNNSFSWKGLYLGFLIDARIGGVGVSATQAKMDYYGTSKASAIARDNGGVNINNGRLLAQDYYNVVGNGMTGVLANYVYSMTNVRLREATLGYTLPTKWFNNQIQNLTVSLIGKNLFMFHNKAPFDPELSASTGTYYQGFDYFMQPSVRSIGFSVKFQY
ncbi:SusC/RagA family TonB-linked outer membrane protein [Bacteroides acidifaciens]|uniref:SusC/RagA family TonB-linked outer membrane protein n=1 Tax=Bacteroides acidifaciens TaxID=85831 RepID=UPI0023CFD5E7|nr:SusC/RagA family TonB-linked outer membrane protein [Bacteroides acidifaciens]MDE6822183.1 SusC/RagA family TonB-linked outer membrane protein [Bacteroides acidifaciens]